MQVSGQRSSLHLCFKHWPNANAFAHLELLTSLRTFGILWLSTVADLRLKILHKVRPHQPPFRPNYQASRRPKGARRREGRTIVQRQRDSLCVRLTSHKTLTPTKRLLQKAVTNPETNKIHLTSRRPTSPRLLPLASRWACLPICALDWRSKSFMGPLPVSLMSRFLATRAGRGTPFEPLPAVSFSSVCAVTCGKKFPPPAPMACRVAAFD